jgi:hypothetical protein
MRKREVPPEIEDWKHHSFRGMLSVFVELFQKREINKCD